MKTFTFMVLDAGHWGLYWVVVLIQLATAAGAAVFALRGYWRVRQWRDIDGPAGACETYGGGARRARLGAWAAFVFPLLIAVGFLVLPVYLTLTEGPASATCSASTLCLEYRWAWRNVTIPLATITSVAWDGPEVIVSKGEDPRLLVRTTEKTYVIRRSAWNGELAEREARCMALRGLRAYLTRVIR